MSLLHVHFKVTLQKLSPAAHSRCVRPFIITPIRSYCADTLLTRVLKYEVAPENLLSFSTICEKSIFNWALIYRWTDTQTSSCLLHLVYKNEAPPLGVLKEGRWAGRINSSISADVYILSMDILHTGNCAVPVFEVSAGLISGKRCDKESKSHAFSWQTGSSYKDIIVSKNEPWCTLMRSLSLVRVLIVPEMELRHRIHAAADSVSAVFKQWTTDPLCFTQTLSNHHLHPLLISPSFSLQLKAQFQTDPYTLPLSLHIRVERPPH